MDWPYALSAAGELPPRARRILDTCGGVPGELGTTSACAENTQPGCSSGSDARNYLRVRGEYKGVGGAVGGVMELPPRARRIPVTTDREL